jgi:CubicO group peptidase (beta-lactamase class C family)
MPPLDNAFAHIDEFAARWIDENQIPGLAIAITDRDKLLRISTFGLADVAGRVPVTPDTLFEIGSLGKPFTSIAMLQLRDEGKLDLNAPVSRYLPWFEVQSEYAPIQVHHLMNHTAGIARGTDIAPHGLYESWALRESKACAAPGEYFSYSNIGYKTVGFVLERLAGQTLEQAIRSRVIEPLGMTRTHAVITQETRKATAAGYCGFYDDRPEHPSHDVVPAIWAEYSSGDGCQASTAGDMAIYLRMLLNRGRGPHSRLISDHSFELMTTGGIWTGGDFYGYGLATYPVEGTTYIGHGGGNAAFRSALVVDMKAGLGVVFLLNRMGETDPIVDAAQHALTVVRAAKRRQSLPAPPPPADPCSVRNAKDYAGAYRAGRRKLRLTAERGNLRQASRLRAFPVGLQEERAQGRGSFSRPSLVRQRPLLRPAQRRLSGGVGRVPGPLPDP